MGTFISFRIGAADAEYVAKEFTPIFSKDDLVSLPKYSMYIKLMIDGATSLPFSATTEKSRTISVSFKSDIINQSRKNFGRKICEVADRIFIQKSNNDREHPGLFDG